VERTAAGARRLTGRGIGRAAAAVARHPSLWGVAWVQGWRLAPRGWWRRFPFLPVPARDYLRFRLQTQYGDPDHAPDPADLVAWLRWCKRFPEG
jgi:hypothetical protein